MKTKRDNLVYAFLSGLTATRLLYPTRCTPIRYPYSHKDDLNAIGADMWKVIRKEINETESQRQTERHSYGYRATPELFSTDHSTRNP